MNVLQPRMGAAQGQLLVVDDQRNMRATTALLLREQGYQVAEASSGEEALGHLVSTPFDLMITDLRMEPIDGLTLIKKAQELSPQTQIIVMTAYGSIESAVEAMRRGAFDYITKPFKEPELVHRTERALERARLLSAVQLFAGDFNRRHGLSALVGQSAAMKNLTSTIVRASFSQSPVLIVGEPGTGKELVARAIHAQSRRSERPFVTVECTHGECLMERVLFGDVCGIATGLPAKRSLAETAEGGTIFIDEISETKSGCQAQLLQLLEAGHLLRSGTGAAVRVDVRALVATEVDLEKAVAEHRFLKELYERLTLFTIRVPPLRERVEDIPLLAEHFLQRANMHASHPKRLTPEAVAHLVSHHYPGNVRELENLVEQAAMLSESDELGPEDFPLQPRYGAHDASTNTELPSLAASLAEAERQALQAALDRFAGDLPKAAQALEITPTMLWRKLKRLGPPGYQPAS